MENRSRVAGFFGYELCEQQVLRFWTFDVVSTSFEFWSDDTETFLTTLE